MNTELEAVNYLLRQIGSHPVTSLTNQQPDVAGARQALADWGRTVQGRGWWFNEDLGIILEPDVDNRVPVPSTAVQVTTLSGLTFSIRDGFLYDPYTQSDEFTGAVRVSLTYVLDYDDCPISAQDLIRFEAAKDFILSELEDYNKANTLNDYIGRAQAELNLADAAAKRRTLWVSPSFVHRRGRVRPYRGVGGQPNPTIPGG